MPPEPMIKELKITNFAIIENLTAEFDSGLTVLTGETGAGKSIIMDALNLILGGRGDTGCIRSGENAATVEARIALPDKETMEEVLALGIEVEDGEIIIKRNLSRTGKNRCLLNDSLVTVGTLSTIGNRLVDIHGQHDHQALLHPETHVDFLDRHGRTLEERKQFAGEFSEYQAGRSRLEEMRTGERDRLQREDLLKFQVAEIDEAGLNPGEEEELKGEKNKLRHAEKTTQTLEQILHLLTEGEGSALERLGWASKELHTLTEIDPKLKPQTTRSETAYYEIQELVEELRDYSRTVEFNPGRLEEIDDRLAEINRLKRKYGADEAAVLAAREQMAAELESLSSNQEQRDQLEKALQQMEAGLAARATALADRREKTAGELKTSMEKELKDLSMQQVQFDVRFDYEPDPEGFVKFRGQTVRLNPTGLGTIEFLFSPNPGEALRPLSKIVSGGELSRVVLALKSILHKHDSIPTMVFDEIDAGIGGKVAETVGRKLKKIAGGKQIFCITHLPQIAGMGSAHFKVQKEVKEKRTRSSIRKLSHQERIEEIARMSAGEKITETTLKHAREMMK